MIAIRKIERYIMAASQLPLLELDLLKTLIAIAETGNFSSAADAVFRTPSAISMQVKKIEEIVERPVFIRDSRSVSLTPDGLLLLEHARRVLALNNEMIARFVTPDIAGVVRMGAPDDAAERLLPEMLRRFSQSHPCVTVDVVVDDSQHLIERVKQSKLDLSLITCDAGFDDGREAEILMREKLVWAGLKSGVAAEQNPLPVSVWEEGCIWRTAGLKSLEDNGVQHRVAFQSANISGQKAAILADLAVAPIPVSSIGGDIVQVSKLNNLPALPDYAMGMMLAENMSEPAKAAAEHLRACFELKQAA